MSDNEVTKPEMDPRALVRQVMSGDIQRQPSYQTDYATALANKYGLYVTIKGIHAKSEASFRAFITSFNESFTTQLKSESLVGHYEPLRKVTGIERVVSLSLSLPTFNLDDAILNLNEVKKMVNLLYPRTEQVSTGDMTQKYVKSGGDPIFRVKFANLIANSKGDFGDNLTDSINPENISTLGQKGYIDNFNYEFDTTQGFYVIKNGYTYPKLINLSFNFYPLHEVSPSWTSRSSFDHKNLPYATQPNSLRKDLESKAFDTAGTYAPPSVDSAGVSGLDSVPPAITDHEGSLILGRKVLD